jgi:hypothetical protein
MIDPKDTRMDELDEALLPCPLCGSQPEVRDFIATGSANYVQIECTHYHGDPDADECTSGVTVNADTMPLAIAAWNRRSTIGGEPVRPPDFAYTPHDWEYTAEWSERGMLTDELPYGAIEEVATLFRGPTKWAAHVATTYDDAGDPDQTEVLWFDSEEDARRAISTQRETRP